MRLSRFGLVVLAFCLFTGLATAGSFSFTGTFVQDDQLQIFLFTAPSASVTLRTWSYAGTFDVLGNPVTNAAGNTIPVGGFDPALTVFDAGTVGLGPLSPWAGGNNDGDPAIVAVDPATGNAFDSLLLLTGLDPTHTYALVLSENDNLSPGYSSTYGDGFSQAGQGDFTAGEQGCAPGTPFCQGPFAPPRSGQWAVDILGVRDATEAGSSPEPGSMLLLATGIGTLALLRRRGKQRMCATRWGSQSWLPPAFQPASGRARKRVRRQDCLPHA
jgi:hypothetical protein